MGNALKDILGFVGGTADALLLGGTVGASRRRNQFADYLGAGQYDEAEQLALRNGEGAYAQVAQQRAASASAQAAAEQKRQQEQFKYIQNSAAFLDSLTPDLQKAYLDLNGPALVEQGVLDEEDLPILYQNVGVPAGFTGLARSAIDPNQQQQNIFEGQTIQETARSNRATEGLRGGELAVSQRNLALRQQEFEHGSNGISFTTPDGSVVQVGGRGPGLGTKGKNDLDTRRINSADQLQRLNQITAKFDEKFLRSGPRLNNLVLSLKDKGILPGDLSPEDESSLIEFSEFRQAAFNNLNNTLREMSGAAITPQEAERLLKSLPNPGKGVFDGDSPSQFQAKTSAVTQQLKLAIARYNYSQATGEVDAATGAVSLDQMRSFINERAQEIEQQLRQANPGATEDQIQSTVRAEIRRLFGNFQ